MPEYWYNAAYYLELGINISFKLVTAAVNIHVFTKVVALSATKEVALTATKEAKFLIQTFLSVYSAFYWICYKMLSHPSEYSEFKQ